MPVTVETGATLAFERFWRWLKRHPNCILRAGTPDAYLFDADDLHWHLEEDEERTPSVQVLRGKALLGEILIEAREILFELVGGSAEEPAPMYHFVVAHGFEEGAEHGPQLKQ